MKNVFSYDSPLMTVLGVVADTMLLNLLFLLFCLPVVTIGPAATALFTACRAMEEDTPCYRAFFRAFVSSLRRAVPAWLIELAGILLFAWCAWVLWYNKFPGYTPAFVVSSLALILLLAMANMTFLFYSRFECTLRQLLRNGLFMTLGYSLRAVLMGVAMWAPVLMFFLLPATFLRLAIAWVLFYFAAIANLCVRLMKTPFRRIAEQAGGEAQAEDSPDDGKAP